MLLQFDEQIFLMGWSHQLVPAPPQKSEGGKNLKKRDFCGQFFCFVCDDNKPVHIRLDLGGTMAWQRKILWNQQEIRKETKATPVFESVFTFQVSPVSAVYEISPI